MFMHRPPKSRWLAAAILLAMATLAGPISRADDVTQWTAIGASTFAAKGANGSIYGAILQTAVYDAVNAIDGRHRTYAIIPQTPTAGASQRAAAAAAGYYTLIGLWPDQQAALEPVFAASLAAIGSGWATDQGVAIGREVANANLALRSNDGRTASITYVFGPVVPGEYQRTVPYPPSGQPVINPALGLVRPFAIDSPSQFRPDGPPALDSEEYAEDYNETKVMGALVSPLRSDAQTEIARFHTENPTLFWGRNLSNFVASRNLSIADSARLSAMIWVAQADAFIGCVDAKYHFRAWRPFTAIRAGDTDGNAATVGDPAWLPLANTPPHPEYPSAHGCITGAVVGSMRAFFGTKKLSFAFNSTVTGQTHSYSRVGELASEVSDARVFGGMHFRFSNEDGLQLGRQVAKLVTRHYFKRVDDSDDDDDRDDRGRGRHDD